VPWWCAPLFRWTDDRDAQAAILRVAGAPCKQNEKHRQRF
jgi:hypothetical protein